jgi:hypothetical protein
MTDQPPLHNPIGMTLEALAAKLTYHPDNNHYIVARAEIMRRQTQAQLDACAAQIAAAKAEEKAANAAVDTAGASNRNANYML